MIDTDEYEGHSEDEWVFDDEYIVMKNKTGNTRHVKVSQMNMNLMLDAPLFLEAYKRLREGICSILSDYDITELIRDVPEDEWNFEQQALIRMKELIE